MKGPTVREIPADTETPVTAFLKLRASGARFLLESVEQGETLGRYSFIGVGSSRGFRILDRHVLLEDAGTAEVLPIESQNPLALARDRLLRDASPAAEGDLPPLVGGAVGYLSYDFVRFLERLPAKLPDDLRLPVGHFILVQDLVVFDHLKRKIILISTDPGHGPRTVEGMIHAMAQPLPAPLTPPPGKRRKPGLVFEMGQKDYEAAVREAKEHIAAGDIFQVVLSHRARTEVSVHPFQVYRALRILNPSPYMTYLDFGEYQLVGSSPEVHVKLQGRTATIRPIAGTRPRGATPEEDRRLEAELLADEKERAEHLMLIDLARNDLGRSCEYGSVEARDLFRIERYSHVMHIASEVRGRLREDCDPFALLSHTFPAGTVSGAPKIRAMEIIEELERSRRGPYAGTMGYFSLTGDLDMCITIRTILFKGATAYLQGGAGIVHDSHPTNEWKETLAKIEALRQAIEMAESGFLG